MQGLQYDDGVSITICQELVAILHGSPAMYELSIRLSLLVR